MNRWFAVALALLFLPVAFPATEAQDAASPVKVLEDATGDTLVNVGGTPQSPNGRWAAADLTSLTLLETLDAIEMTFGVGNLENDPEIILIEDVTYQATFLVGDTLYRVVAQRQAGQGTSFFTQLQQYDPGRGDFSTIAFDLPMEVGADAFSIYLERGLLLDSQGNTPGPATPLGGFHATVESALFGGGANICIPACAPLGGYEVSDRMPDAGNGTIPFALVFGITQTGTARLASDVPIRTSNGEATTFVFQVQASNLAAEESRFSLVAANIPNDWELRLPANRIDIPANGTVLFPVLATVPFSHSHGLLQAFTLELASLSDSVSVGRIQLGVRYAQPPQPAGHHDLLTFHSHKQSFGALNDALQTALSQPQVALFMNAESDDPLDDGSEVPGDTCGGVGIPTSTYCWTIPLSPGLDLGLDFDLARTGALSVPIRSTVPFSGAGLSGELFYYPAPTGNFFPSFDPEEDGAIRLANLAPDGLVEISANSPGQVLAATLTPTEESDYIPYLRGASLELRLRFEGTGIDPTFFPFGGSFEPLLQSGGSLSLPLIEYHDKVEGLFAAVSTLSLEAISEQDRLANPGDLVLFDLVLQNEGEDGTFRLDLTGTHLSWASIVEPILDPEGEGLELAEGANQTVRVLVRIPDDAVGGEVTGDIADLVLSATSTEDLNRRALVRLVARVDTETEHDDDRAAAESILGAADSKSTPGLAPLSLLAALAALVLAVRRRRETE
ncbi:MAG: hypothetical protein AABX89_00310 [Candidatus Thermoplasmatota archaeon]